MRHSDVRVLTFFDGLKSEDRGNDIPMSLFDILPNEIITAICELDPVACQLLWIYMPNRREIKSSRDWAAVFAITEIIDNVIMTRLYGDLQSIDDYPAIQSAHANGWFHRGLIHRDGGPAIVLHHTSYSCMMPNNLVESMSWGSFEHRNPASFWLQHGEFARVDNPHVIETATSKFVKLPSNKLCVAWTAGALRITFDEATSAIEDIRVMV